MTSRLIFLFLAIEESCTRAESKREAVAEGYVFLLADHSIYLGHYRCEGKVFQLAYAWQQEYKFAGYQRFV